LYWSCSAKEIFNRIFYKNADADELIFIHKGKGKLRTMLGNIPYETQLIIPRGIIYQIQFDTEDNRLFYVLRLFTPKRYKNESGQHLEHSFCERDFILPSELKPMMKKGDF
jgi:homogentisate 1,2-dioxygenase